MKKWTLRICLLVGGPLLALLLVESIWQLIGDPRIAANDSWLATRPAHFQLPTLGLIQSDPDPQVSFRLTPGFSAEVEGKRYTVNQHGMRGEDLPIEKPAGSKRILVLGDSYAFGFGVDDEDTISAQLERALRPDTPSLQVLNMGVPGYQSGQELKVLERDGMQFSPDVVVLVYYANDNVKAAFHWDPRLRLTYVDELGLPHSLKQFLARSIIYSKVTKAYTATLGDELNSRGPMGLKHNWSTTAARLTAIRDLCKQRGAALIVVALPGLDSSTDFIDPDHDFNVDQDRVLQHTAKLGAPTIDFRATLLRWSLGDDGTLPASALESPVALRADIARRINRPATEVTVADIFQSLVTSGVTPKPIERAFVGPEPPLKDSHLNAEGYQLLAAELAALIRARKLLR